MIRTRYHQSKQGFICPGVPGLAGWLVNWRPFISIARHEPRDFGSEIGDGFLQRGEDISSAAVFVMLTKLP
jgi:hypothetical protein